MNIVYDNETTPVSISNKYRDEDEYGINIGRESDHGEASFNPTPMTNVFNPLDDYDNRQTSPSTAPSIRSNRGSRHSVPQQQTYIQSLEETAEKKGFYLVKIRSLSAQLKLESGYFSMNSSIEELINEYYRLNSMIQNESLIKAGNMGLHGIATGIELMDRQFKFSGNMDGYSQHMQGETEKHKFDDVLIDLAKKYNISLDAGPELNLVKLLAMSAVGFHMAKNYANDIKRQREEEVRISRAEADVPRKMKGPSQNMLDALKGLNIDEDDVEPVPGLDEDTIEVLQEKPKKKRGRKKKE